MYLLINKVFGYLFEKNGEKFLTIREKNSEEYDRVLSMIKSGIMSKEGKEMGFICLNWFKLKTIKYQPYVCNGCHDLSLKIMELSDFFIFNVGGNDYRVYIANIDKKRSSKYFKQ